MFDRLDFIYLPSRDVAADVEHYTRGLGAEFVFAIEAFGTRVAMVRLAADPPPLLLAGHLQGDQPVLVYRVEDLDQTVAQLRDRQVDLGVEFEIPHGRGTPAARSVRAHPARGRRATRRTARLLSAHAPREKPLRLGVMRRRTL
jgi:hypothetical protein